LSLKKLVYLDGEKAVLYRSKMNSFLGRNFEAMDPQEWLARLADHIPDTGSKERTSTPTTPTGCAARGHRRKSTALRTRTKLPRNVVALRAGHA
jgi:hypothetical protein